RPASFCVGAMGGILLGQVVLLARRGGLACRATRAICEKGATSGRAEVIQESNKWSMVNGICLENSRLNPALIIDH
ncbi:MAG: hypothetical protein L0H94_05770, partial [Nitrospira sp.]|nr:hypothetical protein [Nitrospira sp.]